MKTTGLSAMTGRVARSVAGIVLAIPVIAFAGQAAPSAAVATAQLTWSVSPGGSFSATAPAEIRNVTKDWTISCQSLAVSGAAESGTDLSGEGLLSFTDVKFSGCTGPRGLSSTISPQLVPWPANAESYDSGAGKTTGVLSLIEMSITVSNDCNFDVAAPDSSPGVANAVHTNADGVLALSGERLGVFYTGFACTADLVATGDTIELSSRLPLNPKQTVTSP